MSHVLLNQYVCRWKDVDDGGKKVGHVGLHVIPRVEGDYEGDTLSDILEQRTAFVEGLEEVSALDELTPEFVERAAKLRAAIAAI